jgi:hypothetical protein
MAETTQGVSMRKSLTLACSALLIALPSFAFAQEAGAGGAGVGNSDSSAGVPGNVHSSPNSIGTQPGGVGYEGRSSATMPAPQNKVGDMPSSRESIKGNDAGNAHPSE